jgi:hypothetical protein
LNAFLGGSHCAGGRGSVLVVFTSYQEGTQIDGAKYTISESTSIKENTFYDWQCNTCNYLKNYKESFSHFIYLICILLGIYLIYGAVFGLY